MQNLYFPPRKMLDEINANISSLITQYPSGMEVNSLLAAKNFGVSREHIVVGNGAAELIKALMERTDFRRMGFIRPTFEEYPNRFCREAAVYDTAPDFCYGADEVIHNFQGREIDALVVINPDNPSGNYMDREGVLRLIAWAREQDLALILNESFIDFVDSDGSPEENSVLREEILISYEKLYVVKSISKSYGIPGLRLGILASSDEDMIRALKEDVAIWNINSVGEFFMQIYEKYKGDYHISLKKVRQARQKMERELEAIPCLKVYRSQANYIMCGLSGGMTGRELAVRLLEKDFFIKDLSRKIGKGQYIRLAVRTEEENTELVEYLRSILL